MILILYISADRTKRLNPSVSSVATVKPNSLNPFWSPVKMLWTKTLAFRGFKLRNLGNQNYRYQTDLPVHLTKKKAFRESRKIGAKRNIFDAETRDDIARKCVKWYIIECFYTVLIESRDVLNAFFVSFIIGLWSILSNVANFPWKHVNELLMVLLKWFILSSTTIY